MIIDRRARGDQGSGLVAAIAFMFAFTFLGLVWLAGTVDRGISNQSAATSIAFQAARSGAQTAQIDELRGGVATALDDPAARAAARATAAKLFDSYGVDGEARVDVDTVTGTVTVVVTIVDGAKQVIGTGAAKAVEVT